MLNKEIEIAERMGEALQDLIIITQMSENQTQARNLLVVVKTLSKVYDESVDELKDIVGGIE